MKKWLFLFFFMPSFCLYAVENSPGLWYGFFNEAHITERFSWWTEAQLRHDFDEQLLQQTLIRTGLLFQATGRANIGFLYAYIGSDRFKEHRLTLQHVMVFREVWHSTIAQRLRLEYRTLEQAQNLPERFRYALRAEKQTNWKVKPFVSNEIFFNLKKGKWLENDIFDRNRLFIGGRYPFKTNFNVELGYMNQFVKGPRNNLMEHLLVLYLMYVIE